MGSVALNMVRKRRNKVKYRSFHQVNALQSAKRGKENKKEARKGRRAASKRKVEERESMSIKPANKNIKGKTKR